MTNERSGPVPKRSFHTAFSLRRATLWPVTDNERARILVAEDDRAVRESLVRALQLEGYTVVATANGGEALEAIRQATPHVLLLDVSMPVVDGLTVCRVLRSEGNQLPVLMLTARTETSDRVAGLDAGADDYLPKPYDLDELLARLRALLRRSAYSADDIGPAQGELVLGDLRIDPSGRRVFRGEREVLLSKTEFDLLELLVMNRGIVLDHTTIYERIWHYDFGPDSKNLAVYIGYLRRKTEADGEPRIVHTVRGVGYTARIDG
jgi:two-component system response regulator MprA